MRKAPAISLCSVVVMVMGGCIGKDAPMSPKALPKTAVTRPDDLRQYIDDALAAGTSRIVIPPGTYRVKPRNREHLAFRDLSDVTIVADGVEMICTETTRAITIDGCRNLTIQGLTIDYDPLPYTQGRIVELSDDNTVHEIELFDGYPSADKVIDQKYEIFRPDTRTLRFGSYHSFKHEKAGSKRIIVTRGGRYMGEQVGDIIAIAARHAPGGNVPHAVAVSDSEGVVLQDITVYASNCFAFFGVRCTRTHYLRCKVARRPAAIDLKKRQDPRIRSVNADAFNCGSAIVGPIVEDCSAAFMADDCVNIYGRYHMVMSTEGRTLRVLVGHPLDIRPGSPLEVVSYAGERLPDANAVRVSGPLGKANAAERTFLSRQRIHPNWRQGTHGEIHEIEIDRAVDLPMGSVIGAIDRMGNNFKVTGCTFGFNRSRGIVIRASDGIVRGNTLEGVVMTAIMVAPEYFWLGSGTGNNVTVTGNTIRNCLKEGIAVYSTVGKGGIAPAGAHNNIVITDNSITGTVGPHIRVTSTRGLILRNNSYDPGSMKIENCEDVVEHE